MAVCIVCDAEVDVTYCSTERYACGRLKLSGNLNVAVIPMSAPHVTTHYWAITPRRDRSPWSNPSLTGPGHVNGAESRLLCLSLPPGVTSGPDIVR